MEYTRSQIIVILLISWSCGICEAGPDLVKGKMENKLTEEEEIALIIERTLRNRNNCYDVLGIKRSADDKTIIKAHRKIILSTHPDKTKHKDATEAIAIINVARDTLLNDEQRKLHDFDIEKMEEESKASAYRPRPWNKAKPCKTKEFKSEQSPHNNCTNSTDKDPRGYTKFFWEDEKKKGVESDEEEERFTAYNIPSKTEYYMHVLKSKLFNFAKSPTMPFTKKDFGWKNHYFQTKSFPENQTYQNQAEEKDAKGKKPFSEFFNYPKPESSRNNQSQNSKNFQKHSSTPKFGESSDVPNKNPSSSKSQYTSQKSNSFLYPQVSLAGRNPIERDPGIKLKSAKEQSSREKQKNESAQFNNGNKNFINNPQTTFQNDITNKKGFRAQNASTWSRETPIESRKNDGINENSISNEKIKTKDRKTRYSGTHSTTNDYRSGAEDATINEQPESNFETKAKNQNQYDTQPKTKVHSEKNSGEFVQYPTNTTSKKEKSSRIRSNPAVFVESSHQYQREMSDVTSTRSQETIEKHQHIIPDRRGNNDSSGNTISAAKNDSPNDSFAQQQKMKSSERHRRHCKHHTRGHMSEVPHSHLHRDRIVDQHTDTASSSNHDKLETAPTETHIQDASLTRQISTRRRVKVKKVRRKSESHYEVSSQSPRGNVEYNPGNNFAREEKLKGILNEYDNNTSGTYDFLSASATGPQMYEETGLEDVINLGVKNCGNERSAGSPSRQEKERARSKKNSFPAKKNEVSSNNCKAEILDDNQQKNLFRDQKDELNYRKGEISDDSRPKNKLRDFLGSPEKGKTYEKDNDQNSGQDLSADFEYYFRLKPRKLLKIQIEYLNENGVYLYKIAQRLQKYVALLGGMSEFAYTRSKDLIAIDDVIDLKLLDYSYKMKNLGTYLLETSFNVKKLSKNLIALAKLTAMRMVITDYEDNVLVNQGIDLADHADFLQIVSSALNELSSSINNNSKTNDFLWKLAFKIRRGESWISRIVGYFSNHAKSFKSQAEFREKTVQRFESLAKNENEKIIPEEQNGISQWQSLPKYYCPIRVLKKDENHPDGSLEDVSKCLKELSDFLLLQSHYLYEQAEHFKSCANTYFEINSSILMPSAELIKKFRKQYEVIRLHLEYMPEIPNALIEISNFIKESVEACKIFNIVLARQEIHDFAEEIHKKALYIRQNMEPDVKELSIMAKKTAVAINLNEKSGNCLSRRKFEKLAIDTGNLVEDLKNYSFILGNFSRNWNKRNTPK